MVKMYICISCNDNFKNKLNEMLKSKLSKKATYIKDLIEKDLKANGWL
jgi:predicted DNA-binding protein